MCIVLVIKEWKFPKSRNNTNVEVSHPFFFNPPKTETVVLEGGASGSLSKGVGRGKGGGNDVNASMPSDPVVSRGLTAGEISSVTRRNLNQIRHCYERLLQRRPGVVGKAKTKFIINPNGRVGSARILSSNISDNQFRNCLTRTIKKWKFPKPRNNSSVDVNYPFAFNPR